MAPKAATPEAGEGADGHAGGQPPDPATVYRQVAAWVLSMYPGVRNLRIVGDVPDSSGSSTTIRLPVPVDPDPDQDPDELDTAIVAVLSGLKPGARLNGGALAMAIDEDLDHTAGTFKRAIRRLRRAGRIDSDRAGYWLVAKP